MTKKTKIITIISILVITCIGFIYAIMIYNKPHIDVSKSDPNLSMQATILVEGFENDETLANSKYLEKIIEVRGKISEIKKDKKGAGIVTLASENSIGSVICHLLPEENEKINTYKEGQNIRIKGICTGYLMDVILIKSVIAKNY